VDRSPLRRYSWGYPPPSRHKGFFCSKVATVVVESYPKGGKTTGRANRNRDLLTPREREVAAALRLSVHPAETYRSDFMLKLGTHSSRGLIRYVVRNKIVQA